MDLDLAGTGTPWEHLPLLVRAKSPESMEHILQTHWRTRKTGLYPADRSIIFDMLNLQDDALLDPLLVCLRILIRNIAPWNLDEVGIQGLFPSEILPGLRRLLTLLLLKLQRGWREDLLKDQAPLPRFKAMKWSMVTTNEESSWRYSENLHNNVRNTASSRRFFIDGRPGDSELMFRVPKNTSMNISTSILSLKEQLSGVTLRLMEETQVVTFFGYRTLEVGDPTIIPEKRAKSSPGSRWSLGRGHRCRSQMDLGSNSRGTQHEFSTDSNDKE